MQELESVTWGWFHTYKPVDYAKVSIYEYATAKLSKVNGI